MRGDFLRHFVAFQHVLKRADLEAHFVRHPNQHENFVGTVTVRVNVAFAFQHFHQRFEPQIFARRNGVFAFRDFFVVQFPLGLVGLCFQEALANHFFHAHARTWIAALWGRPRGSKTLCGITLPFWIFAECEFDTGRGALKNHFLRRLAPAQLDNNRLSANGVRAAVQHVRNREAAC